MLTIAIFLFIMAAIFGAVILLAIFQKSKTPTPIVYIHGSIALVALLMLIAGVVTAEKPSILLIASLCIFILAALGGLTMLSLDIRKKPIPKAMALLHPAAALTALALLIAYVMQNPPT